MHASLTGPKALSCTSKAMCCWKTPSTCSNYKKQVLICLVLDIVSGSVDIHRSFRFDFVESKSSLLHAYRDTTSFNENCTSSKNGCIFVCKP